MMGGLLGYLPYSIIGPGLGAGGIEKGVMRPWHEGTCGVMETSRENDEVW